MFISKEEADRRAQDKRNFFSPNYVPPEVVIPEVKEDEGDEEKEGPSESIRSRDIDALITKAVDPRQIRQRSRTLQGQTDVQVAIGTTSLILGGKQAGQLYDLSRQQSEAYREGFSTTKDITEGKPPLPARKQRLDTVKELLAEKAAQRLTSALDNLTDEKIEGCSAPKVSAIAKDMATVMDRVTRDRNAPEAIHFHVWKPEMKTVRDYTTVHVSSPIVEQSGGGSD